MKYGGIARLWRRSGGKIQGRGRFCGAKANENEMPETAQKRSGQTKKSDEEKRRVMEERLRD